MTSRFDPPACLADDVARALAEDIGDGDRTAALLPADAQATAHIVCQQDATICGLPWAAATFSQVDRHSVITDMVGDGTTVSAGTCIATISGRAASLLTAERTALNFLQTLSGTATTTASYRRHLGERPLLLDTRKTIPGLRLAQKYAVRVGGGVNHRIGLFDAILIKENHIAAAGSIETAVATAKTRYPATPIIVEVESIDELHQALAAAPTRILLDDFALDEIRLAVRIADGRCPLEVSGGVTRDNIAAIAATGIDAISIGALTKHINAIEMSMRIAR